MPEVRGARRWQIAVREVELGPNRSRAPRETTAVVAATDRRRDDPKPTLEPCDCTSTFADKPDGAGHRVAESDTAQRPAVTPAT